MRIDGPTPSKFLPLAQIVTGGIYTAQNGKPYRVLGVQGRVVHCCRVLKTGSAGRFSRNFAYGHNLFFTEVVSTPAVVTAQENHHGWTHEGRVILFDGKEKFRLHRSEHTSPTEMDRLVKKVCHLLNAVE